MSDDLELDINNYTDDELSKVLNLSYDYDQKTLYANYRNKIELVNKSKAGESEKSTFKEFIEKAYYKLLRGLTKEQFGSGFVNTNTYDNEKLKNEKDRYRLLQQPTIFQNNSNFLIEPNNPPSQDIFNNPVPKGVINQVRRKTVTKIFSLDSQFRNNYDTTNNNNFIYTLPTPINNVISMKLCTAEIPNTWYQINEYTNKFYIKVYGSFDASLNIVSGTETKITIPIGNWTSSSINKNIRGYFDNNVNGLAFLYFNVSNTDGKTYIRFKTPAEITLMNETYSFNYPTTIPNDMSFEVYSKDEDRSQRTQTFDTKNDFMSTMGFLSKKYTVYSTNVDVMWDVSYNGCLKSERVFGQNKISYFFISINDFTNNSKDSIISGYDKNHFLSKDILARIQVKFGSFFMNLDDGGDNIYKKREYFGPVNIERLHIQLIDKFGNHIDLNNCDYSLSLEFDQLYS